MITVFTPTYNRAYIITNLYNSLCIQSCSDFEWIVVDDGSTDETDALIKSFVDEGKINIKYFKQENGGKHRAINKGVKEANGELFFIVDSDDQITENAIERLSYHYNCIKEDSSFAGVCGLKAYFTGERVGGEVDFDILDCNSLDFRYKYHVKGDMAEVFRTDVLKEYPFPDIEGERFCPEALIWNRIAKNYKLRYFYEKVYLCDYLPDGLTAKIIKIRMDSPYSSMIFYSELLNMDIPYMQKVKAAINFWRFAFCSKMAFSKKIEMIKPLWLALLPIGFILYQNDKK